MPSLQHESSLGHPEDAVLQQQKVNLHAHTTASDGWTTPLETHRFAFSRGMILGITDHNTIAALDDLQAEAEKDPKVASEIARTVVPGIEVQTRQRAELIVYAPSIPDMQEFFCREIQGKLNRNNPRYKGIDMSIQELVDRTRDHDLFIGIPHFRLRAHGLGGGKLLNEELRQVTRQLHDYRDHVHVEHTPVLSKLDNAIASSYAFRHGFPVLANADSHLTDHDRSFTLLNDASEQRSLIEHIYDEIHEYQPRRRDRHIERMTKTRATVIGTYIATRLGVSGLMEMAQNAWQKHHPIDHRQTFIDSPPPRRGKRERADAAYGAGS